MNHEMTMSMVIYTDSQKWFIGRIEYYIQSAENELQIEKQRFHMFREGFLALFQIYINYILVILGIVSTIVVGLVGIVYQQANPSQTQHNFFILTIVLTISAILLIISILIIFKAKQKVSTYLDKIDDAYLVTVSTLYFFKGYFIRKTASVELSDRELTALNDFFYIVNGNRFKLFDAYMYSVQSKFISLFKDKHNFIDESAVKEFARIDQAFEIYQKLEKKLTEEKILRPILYLIPDLFDKDSKVESIANRYSVSRKIEMIMVAIILLIVIIFILHFFITKL
jgi:hypothetical protein